MTDQERFEMTEAWIAGKLSGDALSKFEAALKSDPQLALEAEVMRDLVGTGKDSPRKQLRNTLADVREEESSKVVSIFRRPMFWAAAASLLILVSSYFMFVRQDEKEMPLVDDPKESKEVIEPEENRITPEDLPNEQKPNDEKSPENIVDSKEDKSPPSIPSNKFNPQVSPEKNQKVPSQIAEKKPQIDDDMWDDDDSNGFDLVEGKGYANRTAPFAENPDLEKIITKGFTKLPTRVGLSSPTKLTETYYSASKKMTILFSGNILLPATEEDPVVRLSFFSNQKENLQNREAGFVEKLSLEEHPRVKGGNGWQERKHFSFAKNIPVTLPEGLYYYVFENSEGVVLYVGKIVMK